MDGSLPHSFIIVLAESWEATEEYRTFFHSRVCSSRAGRFFEREKNQSLWEGSRVTGKILGQYSGYVGIRRII